MYNNQNILSASTSIWKQQLKVGFLSIQMSDHFTFIANNLHSSNNQNLCIDRPTDRSIQE